MIDFIEYMRNTFQSTEDIREKLTIHEIMVKFGESALFDDYTEQLFDYEESLMRTEIFLIARDMESAAI